MTRRPIRDATHLLINTYGECCRHLMSGSIYRSRLSLRTSRLRVANLRLRISLRKSTRRAHEIAPPLRQTTSELSGWITALHAGARWVGCWAAGVGIEVGACAIAGARNVRPSNRCGLERWGLFQG